MLIELSKRINEEQLDEELRVAHGLTERPGISVRQPEVDEPGALRVPDELDETIVRDTIAAHVPPPLPDVEAERARAADARAVINGLLSRAEAVKNGGGAFTTPETTAILANLVILISSGDGV